MIFLKESCTNTIIFLAILFLSQLITAHASSWCNQTCGEHYVSYPFGFSSGCKIHLKCSQESNMVVNEFPIVYVNQEKIRIDLRPKCDRPIDTFKSLFTKNFAPMSTNAILLNNCSSTLLPCSIPDISVQTHFESLNCSKSSRSSISCLFNLTRDNFFDSGKYTDQLKYCDYFLSSISSESVNGSGVSLDILVLDLGWWLPGKCQCSEQADCIKIASPKGPGYRCRCKDGFSGDGYSAGTGCRKGSCNLEKHLSGQCGETIRIAVLIGGIFAGSALMVALGLVCCFIRRRFSTSKAKGFRKLSLSEATGINIPIYPYKEIEKATNSFSDKQRLGTGAYGTVYAGKLHNDIWVAIKRIKHRDIDDSVEQVMNEIKLISSVNHPSLVRLLGCSIENGEQVLVYEFMPNGTLCQHLQREKGDGLAWPVRLTIAAETAQAIAYLHSAIDPPIYHRDIKSSNILLDYNFRSKVADFGLSRLGRTEISHISTAPQGTPGYLDPQYHQNFHLSDKSDVYSFGVVLIEIITALKVVDFSRQYNEVNLAALATDRIGKGRLAEIIDPLLDIHCDAWTFSTVHKVAELAFRCLAFDKDTRPSMMEVAAELEQLRISRWSPEEEIKFRASSVESSCSTSSSNISEKPLSSTNNNGELGNISLFTQVRSVKSTDEAKDDSPVSVQDPWLSEQSSPSTSSLLNTVSR
ncbi:wall-associated receptor kinase-like 14 [Ricinus communis]|uniref:wall-associated receptor kinase-like 14 n=1 Tax=Ricinus communis TaxID=3988 RepID=UPI00201AD115|nr:wall-associated receptor kinase-like 14 [Ricinus communis]